jgi:hypothetical protein|tara:strand:- start:7329 stop:7628 length:300 start_codon:yes stop_codon:yes gene_type:complete
MKNKTTYSLTMSNPNEISDAKNPELQFQSMDCEMLSKFAKGELNAQAWIQAEMINRGQGLDGWVGFDEAKDEWNTYNRENGLLQKEGCTGDTNKIAKHI